MFIENLHDEGKSLTSILKDDSIEGIHIQIKQILSRRNSVEAKLTHVEILKRAEP